MTSTVFLAMKPFVTPVSALILLVGTLAGGWIHGSLGNRVALHAAGAHFERALPDQVGQWKKLGKENELGGEEQRLLQCETYVFRNYEHLETGDVISVVVLLGPTGPIAVHTPEICYSSRDYSIIDEREELIIEDKLGNSHTFWELLAKSNNSSGRPLRIVYGWTTGTTWEATSSPRFAFGGAPYLYKLQLSGPAVQGAARDSFDPCKDFLKEFLAQLQPRLVDSRAPAR